MEKVAFGKTLQGEEVFLYRFVNQKGMVMQVTDFGATLQAVKTPAKSGQLVDVVLGYDNATGYEEGTESFGATVGRIANRIGGSSFDLDGKHYALTANNGKNNLHSGLDFYHKRLWKVKEISESSITFSLHSPDMDQGYPGELDVDVTYTLTEDNGVRIDYLAVPKADTIINMTNHSYFNLNGHSSGDILHHVLMVEADTFTRNDAESIPTGEILPVEGTPMDFRVKKEIGRDIEMPYEQLVWGRGYDHNWCLNAPRSLRKVIDVTGDQTGITMEVLTDQPGVQIYTGNFLDRENGKEGVVYRYRQGVCFETQNYPDAIHHDNFPSPVVKAGEKYQTTTIYRFV